MELISDIQNYRAIGNSVLTVGTFDGIHLGHQKIIEQLKSIAANFDALSTLVTFEPHPQLVLKKSDRPGIKILTTRQEKIDILKSIGLERLVILEFNKEFAALSPRKFVQEILLQKLDMNHFIIGHDHAFGKDRQGNIKLLHEMGNTFNFTVDAVGPVQDGSQIISSTNIRNLLLKGDVELTSCFLGRDYKISGTVVKGYGRGKDLGFPTANIQPLTKNKLIPKIGIYATKLKIENIVYNSVTYIGNRPTFDLTEKVIEVHINDGFDKEIYNKTVELSFINFIRDDARFETTRQLVDQIKADKLESIRLLSNKKNFFSED